MILNVSVFAFKIRLRDFLKILEIPNLVISNICKMALASKWSDILDSMKFRNFNFGYPFKVIYFINNQQLLKEYFIINFNLYFV